MNVDKKVIYRQNASKQIKTMLFRLRFKLHYVSVEMKGFTILIFVMSWLNLNICETVGCSYWLQLDFQ